jgi:hypothetical protein
MWIAAAKRASNAMPPGGSNETWEKIRKSMTWPLQLISDFGQRGCAMKASNWPGSKAPSATAVSMRH